MKKNKTMTSTVNGWSSVDLKPNISVQCQVCGKKETTMWHRQENAKTVVRCWEHLPKGGNK